jgi:malto-oligosyltrehalose trehalohydrolase
MKRRHNMPFGAECLPDGSVRFRLWAPAAQQVEVCLTNPPLSMRIPLYRNDSGWFELVTDAASMGSKYKFRIDDDREVPDPASRFQPQDVHGPSEVIDPDIFEWNEFGEKGLAWHGRPWEEAVIYELHVGAFTPQGTFRAARERLDYLAELGVTALELMPVSDFPGRRNWGYDGVLPFAPDSSYGRPEDLKELIQSAHARGMMVLLDVVYNHFGPEGNYLGCYAPQFFTDRHHTPWGNGINFDGPESQVVRDFFIHNALYWLTEYQFDGLRLDAVNAIADDSKKHILTELADAVHASVAHDRHIHLVLENDCNDSHYLQRELRRDKRCEPLAYTAQWNDDIHHALHVLLTNERDGYYCDYSERPLDQLGRCLSQGFAYQGEVSRFRNGQPRGESTEGLPLSAFISFLQNHDQSGNRAFGERITRLTNSPALRAAEAIVLLAPSPPMLFMGEEFGAETPFLFFCDFKGDLATAVTAGRRSEFARFSSFDNAADRERIPDPNAVSTFEASRLNWNEIAQPRHQEWLGFFHQLLTLRREHIVPRLSAACRVEANYETHGERALTARWKFAENSELTLLANMGPESSSSFIAPAAPVSIIYASDEVAADTLTRGTLPAWSVVWFLQP